MPLVKIKDFNALMNHFSINLKKINKKRMKNLTKCQETVIIQHETY